MLFSEIAVQNVAGFPPAARLPLRAGLNAFVSREADVLALLAALFSPSEKDAALRGPGAPRKVALTITADDSTAYRLLRDLDGGRTLLKSDPATKKVVKLSEDSNEIAGLLQSVVGVPPDMLLRRHFFLASADLPSRLPPPKVPEPVTGTSSDVITFTPEEGRRRLPELQQELARAEHFEKSQDAVYDLQQQLEQLGRQFGPLQELEDKIMQMAAKGAQFEGYLKAAKGAESRIRKFPEAVARREAALTALRQKREEYAAQMRELPGLAELLQDRMVLGGLGGGVACIAGAVAMHSTALVALDVFPFFVSAFAAWRWVGEVEDADHTQKSMSDLDELEKRTRKQFEVEAAPVFAAMAAVGAASPDDLIAKIEEHEMLESRRIALERDLEQRRADPNVVAIEQQRAALREQLKAAESVVQGMGFTREAGIIRREVQAAEEAAALFVEDPLAAAVETAASIVGMDPPSLLESFKDRLAQYMSALTDRRFVGVRALAPGQCHVIAANGAAGPLDGLPPGDRDLIVVAVRLALTERVAAPLRRPVVFDEPTLLVERSRAGLLAQMLKSLGAQTQVIVRAYDAPPPGVVDHVASAATTAA